MTSEALTAGKIEEQATGQRQKKEPPPPRYTPNIVPLIDVLFMLLLFFLLSTRFRQQEADIPATIPGGSPQIVDIDKGPRPPTDLKIISMGDEALTSIKYEVGNGLTQCDSLEKLQKVLQARKEQFSAESPVFIKPEGNVRWEYVVQAYNEAVKAKFKTITFTRL